MTQPMTCYTVNNQDIYVWEGGRKNRPLVLLIHGWSSSSYAMSPLLTLLKKRFRPMAVDLPGYGQSPPYVDKVSIAAYADLMAGLLQQVTQRPATLIGHSMGGMISLTMALRHPDLVERLILLCPTISGRLSLFVNLFISPITILERFTAGGWLVSKLEERMVGITDDLMRPASFAEQSGITQTDYYRLKTDARQKGQGKVRAESFWAMREGDLTGKLGQIDKPTLVIWGMEDNTVPLRDASLLADEWPEADLRIIPRAGHWPQFEKPKITRRYINSFLSKPISLFYFD